MATICLDDQVFYNPPVATSPKPMSRSFRARDGDHPTAISRSPSLPPTLLQDARNLPYNSTGMSQDNVIEISSDDDDLGDDRSDTSFPPFDELRVSVREEAESGSVASTGKRRQQEARSPECSPTPSSVSQKALYTKQAQPVPPGDTACEPGQGPAAQGTVWDTTVLETAGASRCGKTSIRDGTVCLGDSDQTSDSERNRPPVPDNREQSEEGSAAPPHTQQSRASIPRLSDDESSYERELANPKPSMQPSASQGLINLQVGRRRHCDTDDREDYRPIEDSDTEHSQDDAIVWPSRRKRRRMTMSTPTAARTASKQQTHLHYTSSRSQQTPTSTQHSKRRRSQRSNPNPLSPPGSTLEGETAKVPAAKFEEWSLGRAVLKRVTLDGVSTFQLQFTWDPCAKHDKDTTTNKPTSTLRRAKYTLEDDTKIRRLKGQGLSWSAIAEHFPGRTPGTLAVRYHTKLKTTTHLSKWGSATV